MTIGPPALFPILAALLGSVMLSCAAEPEPVFPAGQRVHLVQALRHLNMTEGDLGFEKDVAKPTLVLSRVRRMLSAPLQMTEMADECLASVANSSPAACWDTVALWLESDIPSAPPVGNTSITETGSAPSAKWQHPVNRFIGETARVAEMLGLAYARLSLEQRRHLAASLLGDVFLIEDDSLARDSLCEIGCSTTLISRLMAEGNRIDPQPAASNRLSLIESIDHGALIGAAQLLHGAATDLRNDIAAVHDWPATIVTLPTPLGDVLIGTTADNNYTTASLLIIEPGGNDCYEGSAGNVNGLTNAAALAVLIDLAGDDVYRGMGMIGPACAVFGIAILIDVSGNDTYRAAYTGLGAGLFGAAALIDEDGDDIYQALALAQGAGFSGAGILRDLQGNDLYDLGYNGQAYAGVYAVGLLIDEHGNDRYTAGGRHPDYDRYPHRYLSTAQGFAIGMRPFAGGGVAALVDLSGNDSYQADVYGQGVSYWYSVGMLLDEAGHDTYSIYQYGQGSGIHLSLGLLSDRAGNDDYSAFSLAQGNAHDYAAGILLDHAGNDKYTAGETSQGRAINNSFGMLLDAGGNDGYFALKNGEAQGIGHDGHNREYGSLALLLDLAGTDLYTCGAQDGARIIRPDYGIVYDECEKVEH